MVTRTDERIMEEAGIDIAVANIAGLSGEDAPSMKVKVTGNSAVTIFDTVSGEPSRVPLNMLKSRLKLRRKEEPNQGKPVFAIEEPPGKPPKPNSPCLLHPDSPQRKHFNEMFLPICSAMLANSYEVERHMKVYHPTAYAQIEKARIDAEKAEEKTEKAAERADNKAFQRSMAEMATKGNNPTKRGRKAKQEG